MGYIGSSALAIGAAAAVVLAIVIAFHDLALERLRKYCIPTPEEAEWAAAYVDVSDEDVDILTYGGEQLGVKFRCTRSHPWQLTTGNCVLFSPRHGCFRPKRRGEICYIVAQRHAEGSCNDPGGGSTNDCLCRPGRIGFSFFATACMLYHTCAVLQGAESFLQEPDGSLLTGLWDGRIVRLLTERRLQHVASTGVLS